MPCKPIAVDLLVVTPDQLRKIEFGLVKSCHNDGSAAWTMIFQLEERAKLTDPFVLLVKLAVAINTTLNQLAEDTANKGFDENQSSQAMLAADTAKAFKAGKVTEKRAKKEAQAVIAVRGQS
jgi:hypothetical protein